MQLTLLGPFGRNNYELFCGASMNIKLAYCNIINDYTVVSNVHVIQILVDFTYALNIFLNTQNNNDNLTTAFDLFIVHAPLSDRNS